MEGLMSKYNGRQWFSGIRRVFGATVTQIMNLLSKEFLVVLMIAGLIAAPVAYYAADRWLNDFSYHVEMPWRLYGITIFGIGLLTVGIICVQGLKTILTNPTKILRSE